MTKRFRRLDWLELALAVLAREGPSGLTVQSLCHAAGRTRGSLYHHFRDHDGLLEALLEHWAQRDTAALIDAVGPRGSPRHLNDLALALDLDLEVEVRRLVARHPRLGPHLAAVDQARLGFLTELHHARYGDDASTVAMVEYAAFLGLQQLEPRPSAEALQALYARFESLLDREVGERSPDSDA